MNEHDGAAVTSGTDLASDSGCPIPTARDLAWFEAGRVEGIAEGRRQIEAADAADWAALRAEVMPRLLAGIPYAVLAERRGQHDRADAQRRVLRERGVA